MSRAASDLLVDTLRLDGAATGLAERWAAADERGVAALTRREGAAQWLTRRLSRAAPGAGPVATLAGDARGELARNLLVDEAADVALRFLAERSVPTVPIKGTARRAAAALYPWADARATHDVDLLVPAGSARVAWEAFRAAGYDYATDPAATPPGLFHQPPLAGPHRVGIELHESTATRVSAAEAWRRASDGADTVHWRGHDLRIPSATELLWHGAVHAVRHGPTGFRLRFFLDGAAILATERPVDWDEVANRLATGADGADPRLIRAWLVAAAELAGVVPALSGPGFSVRRALGWRLAVVRHCGGRPRTVQTLFEEGTRAELGLVRRPALAASPAYVRTRRRATALVARLLYRAWRALSF